MRDHLVFITFLGCMTLGGCVTTIPLHDPIYPNASTAISYSLEARSGAGIHRIELYEMVSTIDAAGTVTPGTETRIQEWDFPADPSTVTVNFSQANGYPTNRLVTYRFWVQTGRWWWGGRSTRSHDVSFATSPYPVSNQPIPVYAQGDVEKVFDVVFIPDTDITNMVTFRSHVRSMIRDAVFAEPSILPWNTNFNFYINPATGTATDYDRIATDGTHQIPSNWANISFAEAKVLMHQNNLRDYASGGLFSTEQQNRGTMMHEGGHGMFGLADEYDGGVHWEAAELPNNWDTLAGAQTDAPSRGKTASDAREIGTSGWFKICVDSCQMDTSGLIRNDYDEPDAQRVRSEIFKKAGL